LLFNSLSEIHLRGLGASSGARPIVLPADCVRPVGFAADEGMLPYTARSFDGYRLLQEYFAFPEKFLFFDLGGLAAARAAGFAEGLEVFFLLDRAPRLPLPGALCWRHWRDDSRRKPN
jgi:type VI secretion system protein ImpG